MTCLLTGATGFLGTIIRCNIQHYFGLTTIGRSAKNDLICNLENEKPILPKGFDFVIHNSGKAHIVPRTKEVEKEFWDLNHKGTLRLLEAIDNTGQYPQCFVFISTVAVYGIESGENLLESTPLNPKTEYGKSKRAAEEAILEWGKKHEVKIVILRLPLVVGPNPPGNLGKIANQINKNQYFRIKNNQALKSAVCASDIATLIPTLIDKSGIFHLTDGINPSFESIESAIAIALGKKIPWSIPYILIKLAATLGNIIPGFPINRSNLQKITASLTFNDEKARKELNWTPNPVIPVLSDPSNWTNFTK